MLGIIAGTEIYSLAGLNHREINTPYGPANIYTVKLNGKECIFIPRHGAKHASPPHKINYHANIWALKQAGVNKVLAVYACGIISKFKPGDLILAEDFLGFYAPITFYDNFENGIKHMDFSEPYAKEMQLKLIKAAKNANLNLKKNGIIATTHGPRFETKTEINALHKLNANLVNMTNAYESTLLHELEISCAALCIGSNFAAGIKKKKLSHSEVEEMMARKEKEIKKIIEEFAKLSD